jgi:pimeloyl-ACP methyl ester carboxylesterase
MPNLDGTGVPIQLAPGYRIAAPGLLGVVTTHEGREPGTLDRGPEAATPAFDEALVAAGINNILTIELDVQSVPAPTTAPEIRTAANEDGLMLEVPDLGETVGQLVLAIDEDGVVTWNFPLDEQKQIETPTVRGVGGSKRFLIRRNVPPSSAATESVNRGLFQTLGRKILKVLVYRVTDPVLGPITAHFVRNWEEKKRPYQIRSFSPNDYLQKQVPALNLEDWKRLAEGPSLLFVHGTTSTTQTGFASFPRQTLADLYQGYQQRVFAFNHFTLCEGPEENAAWFMDQIPDAVSLEVDVICHSRGGLVARTLAGELNRTTTSKLAVKRIVFVGVPNNGTALADPDNLVSFVDRYTTILNLAPPGPASVVADILEGIITAVKIIAHAALNGLAGLTAMNPRSEFLRRLNAARPQRDTLYYAITADFEPKGALWEMVKQTIVDQVVDRIFKNEKNDLLVPTTGVYKGSLAPGFPIPDERVLTFNAYRGVAHSDYFVQPETSTKLKEWLL